MKNLILISALFFISYSFSQQTERTTSADKIKTIYSINDLRFIDNSLQTFNNIISYNVFYEPNTGVDNAEIAANKGNTFTPEVKLLLQKAKKGDIYYFEEIKVMGPDNIVRKIPGIAFKII